MNPYTQLDIAQNENLSSQICCVLKLLANKVVPVFYHFTHPVSSFPAFPPVVNNLYNVTHYNEHAPKYIDIQLQLNFLFNTENSNLMKLGNHVKGERESIFLMVGVSNRQP